MKTEQEILRFKNDLMRKMPFYGDIVTQLDFTADSSIQTAATDGMKVLYNPRFMENLSPGQRTFVLMHEVFHILLQHCVRDKNKDQSIWNVAADLVVNSMLTDTRMMNTMQNNGIPFEKPNTGLFARVNPAETVENIYGRILEDNRGRKTGSSTLNIRENYRQGGSSPQIIQLPKAGSGNQMGGDLIEVPHSGAGQREQRDKIQQIILEAYRSATGEKGQSPFGSFFIPDALYELTESKKLNWKSLLKGMLTEIQSEETSWATPERKYLHMDMILPGHGESDETLDEVWAFVDCSGSVGKEEMEQFLTQLYRILKEFHCVMHLAYWDTSVEDVYRNIKSEKKLLECIPHHSGGTNINCVYTWLREQKIKPEVMLVLTDGYFGTLTQENARLRRKTIVVLSQNSARVDDNIKKVGKPATL